MSFSNDLDPFSAFSPVDHFDNLDNKLKGVFAAGCLVYAIYVALILALLAGAVYGLWTWLL